jgi:flavin-dependent dehydrogenase
MLMCGDTAGMIHPLCGNGMAMAIHSAKIASELITHYFRQGSFDHQALVRAYRQKWQYTFTRRLAMGRKWQALLLNEQVSELAMATVARSPWLMRQIIRSTHGKPIGL